jgi:hypothetical protein
MLTKLSRLIPFPLCTFVSFVVDAFKPLTTKDTKVHKGKQKDFSEKYRAADSRQTRSRLDAQRRHDRRIAGYNHQIRLGVECSHHCRILRGSTQCRTLKRRR